MAPGKAAPVAPRRGRREHRKHLTRRELLAAGRRLFAERGLYDSRIEDLSRLAGIAKGTLYGYFANKAELIHAVVTNGFSELLGHVHRAAQGAKSRDEAVVRITEAHLAFYEENPDLMRVFHQVRGLLKFDYGDAQGLRQVLVNYLRGLAQVLALTPPVRRPRGSDDIQVAVLLFGAISGITSVRAAVDGTASGSRRSGPEVRALAAMVRSLEPVTRENAAPDAPEPPRGPRREASGASRRRAPAPARPRTTAARAEPGPRRRGRST